MRDASGGILVVEDDPCSRDALVALLEGEGYEVTVAADGEEALGRLSASPPALILLDLMMPNMDGFEFRARQMQHHPELSDIPIIVCSCGADLAKKVESLHVDKWLTKPYHPGELLDEIARRIGPGQASVAGAAR